MDDISVSAEKYCDASQQERIFIYASDKMRRIKEFIDEVANSDVTLLIQGETGVGKEVVARLIHQNSSRKAEPFIKVNCAALPQNLLESELFGYERGAFTGAYQQKPGKFELADHGTIFFDEISEIPFSLQTKFLRVLESGTFSRLGGEQEIRADIRILAATNKNLREAVNHGSFRKGLYSRLNAVNMTIPPLRDREEEIPVFAEYFLDQYRKKYNRHTGSISDRMMEVLRRHGWPGNIRELENVIQRFVLLGDEDAILDDLYRDGKRNQIGEIETSSPEKMPPPLKEVRRKAVARAQAGAIQKALEATNWKRQKAVRMLGISYRALLYKIKAFGLSKPKDSALPPAKIPKRK